jgi:mono/diheme cytochrome c family protein
MTCRILPLLISTVLFVPLASGCGTQETDAKGPGTIDELTSVAPQYREGAKIFVERCSGCHNLGLVGSEGGSLKPVDTERVDGPNFNVRRETRENVLYALHNGGFSSKYMPAGLATGEEAEAVADFLAYYAGFGQKNDRTPDNNTRRYKGDQ